MPKDKGKKKSLFDEIKEAEQKARKEFEKLNPDEQKRYIKSRLRFQHRVDVENACMCGLPIPDTLSDEDLEAKTNELFIKLNSNR